MTEMWSTTETDSEIRFDKETRLALDKLIVALRARTRSPERTLAFRALQQARHWLGEDLAILGAQHPYPNGNNPANTRVDPPADVATRRSDEAIKLLEALDARGGLGLEIHDEIRRVLNRQNHIDAEHTKLDESTVVHKVTGPIRHAATGARIKFPDDVAAPTQIVSTDDLAAQGSKRHVHDLPSPRR